MASSAIVEHPYYPRDIVIPNYAPSGWSVEALFGVFGAAVVLVIAVSWIFTRSCRHMSTLERAIFSWWAVTGAIHLVLEGSFVAFEDLMSSTSHAFLLDAWKEYSKADSRYATRDGCVLAVEAVTAFIEGPACFLILYAMATRRSYSSILQFAVSLGQLYGDVIYFATSFLEGSKHCHPDPLYYWGYFIGMNAIWIVVPLAILCRCWGEITRAVRTASAASGGAMNGAVKSRRAKRE
ncbi:hypothetical protein CLOM_g11210 [Closterium sp. NIES-68]|nr:hypothetical protein CLOM_g11210 [Closterium sp. NIES-68]GJP67560.1 hypothetical protein CLOP_g24365 [Closterium sp. NIES-67]